MRNEPNLLLIVRHAESARNAAKGHRRHYPDEQSRQSVRGIPDHKISLTDRGHDQAKQTGLALRECFGPPDVIYHSGYARTKQTTEGILAAYTPEERRLIEVRHHLFLRERDAGHAYDMTQAEAEQHFPWLSEHWQSFRGFFSSPVNGESLAKVAERVTFFLEHLRREHAGKRIMLVTHGGTIRAFRYVLDELDYAQAEELVEQTVVRNAGVTVYRPDDTGRLVLGEYDTVHWQ